LSCYAPDPVVRRGTGGEAGQGCGSADLDDIRHDLGVRAVEGRARVDVVRGDRSAEDRSVPVQHEDARGSSSTREIAGNGRDSGCATRDCRALVRLDVDRTGDRERLDCVVGQSGSGAGDDLDGPNLAGVAVHGDLVGTSTAEARDDEVPLGRTRESCPREIVSVVPVEVCRERCLRGTDDAGLEERVE
jgi:hypothetical protein